MMDRFGRLAHYVGILILLVWGGVLIYFYTSGRIVQYLTSNATFREQALIAGLVLVVLALFNLLTGTGPIEAHAHAHDHDHDDHGHDHDHDGEGAAHDHAHHHVHEHGHGRADEGHAASRVESEGVPAVRPVCASGCGHDEGHHHSHDHADHHGHEHDHEGTFVGGPVAAIVLLVPILLAAVLTPDAYSARAVRNKLALTTYGAEAPRGIQTLSGKLADAGSARGVGGDGGGGGAVEGAPTAAAGGTSSPTYGEFTRADLDRMVDKSPEGNYMLELIELFYTAGDTEIQKVLDGLPMESVGQVLGDTGRTAEDGGDRLRLFRLYVECCAADARPLSIPVEFPGGLPEFREMAWYKVTGTVTYRQENGVTVPVVEASSLTRVDPPEERMSF